MAQQCYYELLGLTKEASAADIKEAFRKSALEKHPDRFPPGSMTEAELQLANEKFAQITQAHATLSDAVQRRIYDMQGAQVGLRTWRSTSTEIPFRKRAAKAWGPIIVAQCAALAAVLYVKEYSEDNKVEIHGQASPHMVPQSTPHHTAESIGSSLNQVRANTGLSQVHLVENRQPFRQPRGNDSSAFGSYK